MENERAFKGVWIPKEIWLNRELTLKEKVMLVEIDSLDNEQGCFASNKYFADFFGLSTSRVSQIINDLERKKWLEIDYETKDKQIIKRTMKINPEVLNILKGGIKYSKGGYLENAKDNNIYNNNINNMLNEEKDNKKDNELNELCESLYQDYPKHKGKSDAIKHIKALLTGTKKMNGKKVKLTAEEICTAICNYESEIETKKTSEEYILYASTFFNSRIFDYLEEK